MDFSKHLVVCSSAGPEILAFGSHCSANFQPTLDCFIPTFKLKYEDSENIKADRVSVVVFNLSQTSESFSGTPAISETLSVIRTKVSLSVDQMWRWHIAIIVNYGLVV